MSTRLYFAEFPHRLPPRPLRFLSPAFPIPHQPVTFTLCLRLFRMLPANKQISRRNRMEYVVELAAGPQNRRNRELDTLPWDRGAVSSACSAYCPQILKIHPPRLMTTRRRISVFQPAAAMKPVAEQTQHDSMLRDDIEASARFDRRGFDGSRWGRFLQTGEFLWSGAILLPECGLRFTHLRFAEGEPGPADNPAAFWHPRFVQLPQNSEIRAGVTRRLCVEPDSKF